MSLNLLTAPAFKLGTSLSNLFPIQLSYQKKTTGIVIDNTTFNENECMVITVWKWRHLKSVKVLAHYEKAKFILKEIG